VALRGLLRRAGPIALVGLALAFGALSLGYAWIIAQHLEEDARSTGRRLGLVFAGLNDPNPDAAAEVLLILAAEVRALGVPIAVTAPEGHVTASANAPLGPDPDSAAVAEWIARLDRVNPPLEQPGIGTVHYGSVPVARQFAELALIQGVVLLCLAAVTVWAFRWRVVAARDRLWVAMARESAHQLGTPLMSLTGWIGYLRENPASTAGELLPHLEADAERLERVAKRFERIGRPARREPVALGAVAERIAGYFRPRLPTLANRIRLDLVAGGAGPTVLGDPVLIEWALEALVKNAIDALSGRGGRVELRVSAAGTTGRLVVADDGPGVPLEIRAQLFEPGVSTKPGGWGIGLAIARRIVEQHGGRISYHPEMAGTRFVLEFPLANA
jgi:signal transduction histidine kinase